MEKFLFPIPYLLSTSNEIERMCVHKFFFRKKFSEIGMFYCMDFELKLEDFKQENQWEQGKTLFKYFNLNYSHSFLFYL